MLAERLQEMVQERKAYNLAKERALARLRTGFDLHFLVDGLAEDQLVFANGHFVPRMNRYKS